MSIELQWESKDDEVRILALGGEVDLSSAPELRQELHQACEVFRPRLVVDLERVTFIDSTGIGVLVGALKRIRERNGCFAIVCPAGRVRRVFEITGLIEVMNVEETRDGTAKHFS